MFNRILILILFSSPVYAFDANDITPYTSTTFLAIDWLQTREIAKTEWREEGNVILGPRPTVQKVNKYFAGIMLLHYVMNQTDYKNTWNLFVSLNEGFVITHNYSVGIRIHF